MVEIRYYHQFLPDKNFPSTTISGFCISIQVYYHHESVWKLACSRVAHHLIQYHTTELSLQGIFDGSYRSNSHQMLPY